MHMRALIQKIALQKFGFVKISIGLILIFIISWMNAFVDSFVHPEIPFFDEEHLMVGSVTGIFSLFLGVILFYYINWLQKLYAEHQKLYKEVTTIKDNYTELYDLAPFGYVTLSQNRIITELNKSAAIIFENHQLINKDFRLFVSEKSCSDFDTFFQNVFTNAQKEVCEIMIQHQKEKVIYALIEGITLNNNEKCLLTIVDITDRKLNELELKNKSNELLKLNSFFVDRELKMVELKKEINDLLLKSRQEIKYKIHS